MKFGIDIGHNCKGDTGSIGIRKEDDLNIEVGVKVINKLKKMGYNVVVCNPKIASSIKESLYKRAQIANINKVDVYVSIHFNLGGENGAETFAISETSKNIAKNVVGEIAKLGYINRGVKSGEEIYTLKNIKAPAILIKCAFIDSKEDMKRYNSQYISNAIIKGITGKEFKEKNVKNNYTTDLKKSIKKDSNPNIEVLKIQQILNRLQVDDYRRKALWEDGVLGNKTISAIKKFQSIVELKRTGSINSKTMKVINDIVKKPTLKKKVSNPKVIRYVQWRLGTIADGIFGSRTRNSVIKYQRKNKLNTDGAIGLRTWTMLIK